MIWTLRASLRSAVAKRALAADLPDPTETGP
jgi:hypothetical protein